MRSIDCGECRKDNAFCVYCQKQFASSSNLHNHIKRYHKDTIRRDVCLDFEKEFDAT